MSRSKPPKPAPDRLSQFRGRAQVIVSYHNFEATPPMDTVVNRVMKVPADAYKVVTTARKPSDNVRVLAAAKALPKQRMVVLAMGELGFPDARALAGIRRRLHLRRARCAPKAPPPGRSARATCATSTASRNCARGAKIYGVIADPVRHSISPAVHNRAFQSRRVDAVYLPFLVSPACLRDFFRWPSGCRSPASASPFRTSRRSSAIWIWWIRWRGASAR